jgi:hypothetical protein
MLNIYITRNVIYSILVIFLIFILLYIFYYNYNTFIKIPNFFKNKWQCVEGDCIFVNDDSIQLSKEKGSTYTKYNSKKECQKKCSL